MRAFNEARLPESGFGHAALCATSADPFALSAGRLDVGVLKAPVRKSFDERGALCTVDVNQNDISSPAWSTWRIARPR